MKFSSQKMLRQNLWTEKGLVIGALGFVKGIIYKPECNPTNSRPIFILVEFDRAWLGKQFLIKLAYSMTVHKWQGLTLDKAVVDIGNEFRNYPCCFFKNKNMARISTQNWIWSTTFDINKRPAFQERKLFYIRIMYKLIPAIPDEIRQFLV